MDCEAGCGNARILSLQTVAYFVDVVADEYNGLLAVMIRIHMAAVHG